MTYLQKLKGAKDRKDLARTLGYKPSALTSIIYQTPLAQRYSTFCIPKKGGGERVIKAPNPKLKTLQLHLATLLYGCLAEIDEERNASPVSYGFRTGSTIVANAKRHKRRRYVLNLDLEDFFPAFNFGRVRGFFLKDRAFELEEEVATTIAQIACDGTALPQGSPCSPVISELVGQVLDLRMVRLAKRRGVRYSRYADDITLSTNRKEFPLALAVQDPMDLSVWTLGNDLVQEVRRAGFKVNTDKTRMHCRGKRQMVTGLVVNEKANIRSEYYRNARAMCDSLFQTGSYFRSFNSPTEPEEEPKPNLIQNLNPLEGILNHIYAVTQSEERRGKDEQRKNPRAIRKLYRRFLFYKYFMALQFPLIVTEGKTDPIYLKEAIRYRDAYHPRLGKPGKDGFEFTIRFFNYGGQAHEIMGLWGGTGNLKSIPLDYLRNLDSTKTGRKAFGYKPMAHPVILVLDNDEGLGAFGSTVNKNFGVSIKTTSKKDFYHITANLYLIKTPETNGKSCMEDLFPDAPKEKQLNGKKFNPNTTTNSEMEYGKEVFANSVVKPDASNIDFSGFDPLLDRIVAVLENFAKKAGQ